jgi:hypothetical protein
MPKPDSKDTVHTYKGFTVEIKHPKAKYRYKLSGNTLHGTLTTQARFDSAEEALQAAQDFVDDYLKV